MIRKSILFIAAITGIMMSSSCTKEQAVPLDREISISAGADLADETAESKAYTSGNQAGTSTKVCWNSGDQIAVFDNDGANKRVLTLASGAMKETGMFSGTFPGTPLYAAYPASQVESFDGDSFLATIPSAETVKNVTSFSINGTLAFGPVTEDAGAFSTTMKHICGFVKFYAPDEAVKKVTLTVDKNIVGKVKVTFNGDGVPEAVLVEDNPANSKSVSFDNIGGGSMYMFSVLPGTYTVQEIKVEYYEKSGKSARTFKPKNGNTITVVRGESCILGVLPVCDNVVTLDFSTNDQLKLPTKGQSVIASYWLNCTIDKVETSLEVELGVAPDADETSTWSYYNTNKNLMLNKAGSYIKLPVIEGKKIVLLKLSTGNTNGSVTRNVYITNSKQNPASSASYAVQGHAMTPNHTYWSAQKDNVYCETRDVYIYSAHSTSNTCIRSITMYYSNNFNWK